LLATSLLALGIALGGAACNADDGTGTDGASEPGAEPAAATSADIAPAAGAGSAGVPYAPAFDGALVGRIFLIAADDAIDDPTNVGWSFDPVRGEGRRLWRTEEPEVLEWRAAPRGATAAYRESWHAEPKTEALVARLLSADAPADYLVLLDPEIGRLAGHVWAPTGDALAYGRQLGSPAAFDGGEALAGWELHALSVGGARMASDSNDRLLWRAEAEDLAGWSPRLLAWRPESATALLAATPIDGAFVQELWSVTTGTGTLTRSAPDPPAMEVVPAPNGEAVAWLDVGGNMRVLDSTDGADAGRWELIASGQQGFATRPLWSPDGRWLAWTAFLTTPEGERGVVRWVALTEPNLPPREIGLPEASVQALAFGPEGQLLLGAGPSSDAELLAALVLDPAGDDLSARDLGWSLPRGTWEVAWIADDTTPATP
jgi:hypothetical protein